MKKYVELEMEILLLAQQDILNASDDFNVEDDPYTPGGEWW